jgi:3-hexulose-6-phosphate synthase
MSSCGLWRDYWQGAGTRSQGKMPPTGAQRSSVDTRSPTGGRVDVKVDGRVVQMDVRVLPGVIRLQIALDTADLDHALRIASHVVDIADEIEVGTPLLRRFGMNSIERLRKEFPTVPIIADCKIIDYGALETRMALDAGADGVIVQATATRATIEAVCSTAESAGAVVMVDTIGVPDDAYLCRRISGLSIRDVIVHVARDEQQVRGPVGEGDFERFSTGTQKASIALAGGITADVIRPLMALDRVGAVIVGQAIVSSSTPRESARMLKSILSEVNVALA